MLPSSVSVIGTIFVDCKGFARQNYQSSTRNLGRIQFVHGGVGRNVAENLANLNVSSTLVSSVDSTGIGKEVVARLGKSGVNTKYLIEASDQGMGIWMAFLDVNGDLAGSISQMPDLGLLEKLIASKGKEIVQKTTHIVLELDLNISITQGVIQLAEKEKRPVFGIPGNLDVILKERHILGHLDCFICNNFEADLILNQDFSNMNLNQKLKALVEFVDQTGLGSMVVTMGANGSVYYDPKTKNSGYQPVFPVKLVDSSGAGDAFFSGTVMGLARGLSLRDAVVCGTKVAGWTVESTENTSLDLAEKVRQDEYFKNVFQKRRG